MAGLVARGIEVTLDGQPVLHGLDVTVGEGMRLSLIGPTGAGQSTLLRVPTRPSATTWPCSAGWTSAARTSTRVPSRC